MGYPTDFIYGGDDACVGVFGDVLYVAFAVIALLLGIYQIIYLQGLKLLPIYLMPFLSFLLLFDNCVMYYSCNGGNIDSNTISTAYVLNALTDPFFIVILYELCFRLHEARAVHFLCFPFEQGDDVSQIPAVCSVWLVRLVAIGLFIVNIFVNFSIISHDDVPYTGSGGYLYLVEHSDSLVVWLSLIAPIALSFVALAMGLTVHRYGKYYAMGLVNRWKYFWFAVLPLVAGYCFSYTVYPVTSNAGELVLLMGMTLLVWFTHEDIYMTGAFADFLHRSNALFMLPSIAVTEELSQRVEDEIFRREDGEVDSLELELPELTRNLDDMMKRLKREENGGAPSFSVDLEGITLQSMKAEV